MTTYNNVFGTEQVPAVPLYAAYQISVSPLQLIWWNQFGSNPNVVATHTDISTALLDVPTVRLPDTKLTGTGISFKLFNPGAPAYEVWTFDDEVNGSQFVRLIESGEYWEFYVIAQNGLATDWRSAKSITAGGGVTSVGLNSSTNGNILVSGSPITTSGTFQLTLGADLAVLTALTTEGFLARTGAQTWASRVLTRVTNIQIDNPDGVDGNPEFTLSPNLGGDLEPIESIQIGPLVIRTGPIDGAGDCQIIEAVGVTTPLVFNVNNIVVAPPPEDINLTTVPPSGAVIFPNTSTPIGPAQGGYISIQGAPMEDPETILQLVLPDSSPPLTGNVVLGASTVVQNPTFNYIYTVQLGWLNIPVIPGESVAQRVAFFTDTEGTLDSSGVIVFDSEEGTNDSLQLAELIVDDGTNTLDLTPTATIGAKQVTLLEASTAMMLATPADEMIYIAAQTQLGFMDASGNQYTMAFQVPPAGFADDSRIILPVNQPPLPEPNTDNIMAVMAVTVETGGPGSDIWETTWTVNPKFSTLSTPHLSLDAVDNTISSSTGAIHLVPLGGDSVHVHEGAIVHNQGPMVLKNADDSFGISQRAPEFLAEDIDYIWSLNPPVPNAILNINNAVSPWEMEWTTSPIMTAPELGTPASGNLANCTGYPAGGLVDVDPAVLTWMETPTSANLRLAVATTSLGTGALVFNINTTLVNPALGTPASGVLTNCTGYEIADLVGAVTGSGDLVFSAGPVLTAPTLGAALATSIRFSAPNAILDSNGLPIVSLSATGSAVNNLQIANAATAGAVVISSIGTDSNILTRVNGKGTSGANIQGSTAGAIPAAGYVGEELSVLVNGGIAVSLVNNTATNIGSLVLTAGNWLVTGAVFADASVAGAITKVFGWVSTTSASLPAPPFYEGNTGTIALTQAGITCPSITVRSSGSTTVYVSGLAQFGSGSVAGSGRILAIRLP